MDFGEKAAPRLTPRNAQIEIPHDRDRPPGEEDIPIGSLPQIPVVSGHMMHFEQVGQLPTLIEPLAPSHPAIDLLKCDEVGLSFLDDVENPL